MTEGDVIARNQEPIDKCTTEINNNNIDSNMAQILNLKFIKQ